MQRLIEVTTLGKEIAQSFLLRRQRTTLVNLQITVITSHKPFLLGQQLLMPPLSIFVVGGDDAGAISRYGCLCDYSNSHQLTRTLAFLVWNFRKCAVSWASWAGCWPENRRNFRHYPSRNLLPPFSQGEETPKSIWLSDLPRPPRLGFLKLGLIKNPGTGSVQCHWQCQWLHLG